MLLPACLKPDGQIHNVTLKSLGCSLDLVPVQALYARAAARYPSFHEPQLGWFNRRKVPKADKVDEGELAALEDRLSLEQIAHFRAGASGTLPLTSFRLA